MWTSWEIDVRFRLKSKISESTYPSQRLDSPSLPPYFLLMTIERDVRSYRAYYTECKGYVLL